MQSYTYKQVLLGLREEYLKNQKRLDALKNYVNLAEKKEYEEFDFYVFNEGRDKYIELVLRERQSMIVKIIESLSNKIVGEEGKKTTAIAHEYNGEKRFLTVPTTNNYSINDMNAIMADADRILGSEFVQSIAVPKINVNDKDFYFRLSPSNIVVSTGEKNADYVPARFLYTPASDRLSIIAYDDPLYMEHINNVFSFKIPAEIFSDYHRTILDASKNKDKDLSIQGLSLSKIPQLFDITEPDDKSVLLKRVK